MKKEKETMSQSPFRVLYILSLWSDSHFADCYLACYSKLNNIFNLVIEQTTTVFFTNISFRKSKNRIHQNCENNSNKNFHMMMKTLIGTSKSQTYVLVTY